MKKQSKRKHKCRTWKISEEQEGNIWITKLDLDYAYGQIKLKIEREHKKSMYFHRYRQRIYGILPFLERFYGLADIPTFFQERIDRTLEFKHPAWLDDIIIVTKGTIEKHNSEVKKNNEKSR